MLHIVTKNKMYGPSWIFIIITKRLHTCRNNALIVKHWRMFLQNLVENNI